MGTSKDEKHPAKQHGNSANQQHKYYLVTIVDQFLDCDITTKHTFERQCPSEPLMKEVLADMSCCDDIDKMVKEHETNGFIDLDERYKIIESIKPIPKSDYLILTKYGI